MKITKTANGKRTIKISKKEWQSIGKKAGWMKKAEHVYKNEDSPCPKCGCLEHHISNPTNPTINECVKCKHSWNPNNKKAKKDGWIRAAGKKTELEMGIKVEKEHLNIYKEIKSLLEKNDIKIPWTEDEFAEKVAKAHLKEIGNYYTELKKMEDKAKAKG